MRSLQRTHHIIKWLSTCSFCRTGSRRRLIPTNIASLSTSSSLSKAIKPKRPNAHHARLLISGPNASGIIASFSQLLYNYSCDIIDCASESSSIDDFDDDHKLFFQRILFDHGHLNKERREVEDEILRICRQFGMDYRLVRGYLITVLLRMTNRYY
jgi:hypothetical protein